VSTAEALAHLAEEDTVHMAPPPEGTGVVVDGEVERAVRVRAKIADVEVARVGLIDGLELEGRRNWMLVENFN
jgi:ribosomal protein S5